MGTHQSSSGYIRDHIMANTWRLILEGNSRRRTLPTTPPPIPNFVELEELLPEYRRIGLSLAGSAKHRRRQ
jgi:hypothetical protein